MYQVHFGFNKRAQIIFMLPETKNVVNMSVAGLNFFVYKSNFKYIYACPRENGEWSRYGTSRDSEDDATDIQNDEFQLLGDEEDLDDVWYDA